MWLLLNVFPTPTYVFWVWEAMEYNHSEKKHDMAFLKPI